MLLSVNYISDIVHIAGYFGKLGLPLAMTEKLKNLTRLLGNAANVRIAVLGISEFSKAGVCLLNICLYVLIYSLQKRMLRCRLLMMFRVLLL